MHPFRRLGAEILSTFLCFALFKRVLCAILLFLSVFEFFYTHYYALLVQRTVFTIRSIVQFFLRRIRIPDLCVF